MTPQQTSHSPTFADKKSLAQTAFRNARAEQQSKLSIHGSTHSDVMLCCITSCKSEDELTSYLERAAPQSLSRLDSHADKEALKKVISAARKIIGLQV